MDSLEEKAERYMEDGNCDKLDCNYKCETCPSKEAFRKGWLNRDDDEQRKGIWFVTPDYEICCVNLNSCGGYVNPLFTGDYKSECEKFIRNKIKQLEESDSEQKIVVLEKKIRRYEEMIGSMLAAGQMVTQHKEQFDKLRGVDD